MTAGPRAGVADGARSVEGGDAVFVKVAVNGREGTEEQITDVGDDGGAACGDAVLGEDDEKPGEDLIDVRGGDELRELAGENGGEVGLVRMFWTGEEMPGAETGSGVGDGVTATPAGAGTVLATRRMGFLGARRAVDGGVGVHGLLVHWVLLKESDGVCHPGVFRKSAELADSKGVAERSWRKERAESGKERGLEGTRKRRARAKVERRRNCRRGCGGSVTTHSSTVRVLCQ